MYDFAIIGCGASGMVAAINLSRKGKKVIILEHQNRCGKKILASGNGHCNIANIEVSQKKFYCPNTAFLQQFLSDFNLNEIIDFFKSIGLELQVKQDGKMYPKSNSAKSVVMLLLAELKRLGVKIVYNAKISKIKKGFKIFYNDTFINAKSIIIATGSTAAPQLGASGFALKVAKEFNHSYKDFLPSLVPLISDNSFCKNLAGVKIYSKLKLFSNNNEITSVNGDLLFTKYGISGFGVLDISKDAVLLLNRGLNVDVKIDFFPQISKDSLFQFLKDRVDKQRDLELNLWLSGIIEPKIAKEIAKDFKNISEKNLNSKILKELTNILKSKTINIKGFREFKYAEVALGGVEVGNINPKTMESKLIKNLYFIGEAIDITGNRGGYNFLVAWISALKVV